ncbi:low molecular weight protein-tyrosine-phosphatase [Aquamicrobium ahrensii]
MDAKPKNSILFVCLGNICRSPLAQGVFAAVAAEKQLSHHFLLDSAGTGGWHAGSPPDPRSVAVAARYGVDISGQSARKVDIPDFTRFDLILGMDRSNVQDLRRAAPESARDRIHLYLGYALGTARDVPDPYYGGADGFEKVYRMIREASEALSDRLVG